MSGSHMVILPSLSSSAVNVKYTYVSGHVMSEYCLSLRVLIWLGGRKPLPESRNLHGEKCWLIVSSRKDPKNRDTQRQAPILLF